jgi:hypothetical protein
MIRNVFHHQAPFVGSGGPYSPGPATSTPLSAMGKPLDDDLSSPWAFGRSSPVFTGELDSLRALRPMRPPTVSPADFRSVLGPRSLDPAALFGARMPSLFEARRRLPTSATAFTTCGQPNPGSYNPRRDGDLDLLPFLLRTTPLPRESGDTRRAALRPSVKAPVKVRLGYPRLPNRDARPNAPPPRLAPGSIVRIDMHGSKDRAKDASPSACDDLSCLRWVHTLCARMLTAFPSSATFGHPLSSARLPAAGIPLRA